ncbi:MAG: threonine ammonia-lyase [Alphaproteobacteria bacterium]|jgi:threonine dehydratase|nr:threonine ammonia-lyase [Alphaproteobacteria bacterium]
MPVTLEDVQRAASAIKGAIEKTPFHHSRTLSQVTGADVYLKFENLQFTASFKERGALNKLLSLTLAERKAGVIAMSAGNHAQGVAYHASRLGIPATIVMPESTPFVKVKHTMGHGARVIQQGATLADSDRIAHEVAAKEGLVFVHPYDDDHIIAGQGTVALEMLEANPDLDTLVVPVGGGGLISGMAIAAKAAKPSIRVIGVETELYPSMYNVLKGGNAPIGGQTIAEGIAVKNVGAKTVDICGKLLDDIVLVPEVAIERAIALLLSIEKTVVEGAGAAGFAALLEHPQKFTGHKVGLVLCGGNIDPRLLSNVIMRELQREGRILTIAVEIEDRPGILARVATIVGEAGGNIIEVAHNRMLTDVPAKAAELRVSMETRDAGHAQSICQAVRDAGYGVRVLGSTAHH